jgi:hypothetical protein
MQGRKSEGITGRPVKREKKTKTAQSVRFIIKKTTYLQNMAMLVHTKQFR